MKTAVDPQSLQPPPVEPFREDDVWHMDNLVDEKTKKDLEASQEALNRPEAYQKMLIGFHPLPD